MPGRPGDPFEVTAEVTRVLGPGVFRAVLRNGHGFVAHAPRAMRAALAGVREGARLRVRLSPFDMADGLVLAVCPEDGGAGA